MADRLRWGILATGGIARQFAEGLAVSKTGTLTGVASRSLDKAAKFAGEFGGTPYEGFDALLASPEIDAVYIATPHHKHKDDTIAAARAGKGILCEKPFTLNYDEADEAIEAVREAGVFFMEAFMYRCSPQTLKLAEILASGAIGEPQGVNAEFGFAAGREWDNFRTKAALGGGGLMDVGGYCVSFARMVFGHEPGEAFYVKGMDEAGYDGMGTGLLAFDGGKAAHFGTGIHLNLNNDARIYGTEGWIHVSDPWKSGPEAVLTVHGKEGQSEVHRLGVTNAELYAAEADAVAEFWEAKECPYVSRVDTLEQARTLDKLKLSAGMKFATDKTAPDRKASDL